MFAIESYRPGGRWRLLVVLLALLGWQLCGCVRTRHCYFLITNYDENGAVRHYRTTFDEAYYDIDREGNLDLVLKRAEPSQRDGRVDIVQVLHLRTVWRSIPGRTVAESTQINATISYHIMRGTDATAFEGAGSVFFKQSRNANTLAGSLDLADLKPTRTSSDSGELFHQAQLSGEFRATRDPRKVIQIVNEMERRYRQMAGR